jgi:gluconate kinase
MGVSGSGKSTVGRAVADRLGWEFIDADQLHPQANLAKMAAGHPLTDADRWRFSCTCPAAPDEHAITIDAALSLEDQLAQITQITQRL